jgi:predicted alpha/beta-hydrolase family hydrolase
MSAYTGPRRGADRTVLLAHGAGSDHRAPALVAVADALGAAGIPSLRFDYP